MSGLDASSNREYVVDLKCSGTATESEYELSSDHFVIGGANPVTTITVTSLNYSGKSKNLDIALVAPQNFNLGEKPRYDDYDGEPGADRIQFFWKIIWN